MVMEHEKAVKLFEQASKELKNEKLKDYATKSLPAEGTPQMAKDVQAKVGGRAGTDGHSPTGPGPPIALGKRAKP